MVYALVGRGAPFQDGYTTGIGGMSMANRNDSDARQHETLPGPGPGPSAASSSAAGSSAAGSSAAMGGGGRPVEQMMDAAIERIAVERSARERNAREPTLAGQKGSVELARRSATEAALARRDAGARASKVPTRLRWKGLDVSDEFRQYAERIARGEELPPFEGRVLAEPNPAFPWGDGVVGEEAVPKQRGAHPAVWGAAIVVLGLLGWSVALKLQGVEPSASVETTIAPLAAPPPAAELEPQPSATSPDGVATSNIEAPTTEPAVAPPEPPSAAEPAPAVSSSLAPEPATPASSLHAEVALATPAPSPPPAATGASVAVDLARPGALQQAIGAALAGRNGAPPAAESTSVREDEFGIMASVSPAPATPPPAATSGAVAPAPAGAKSNGSVGDLARASQPAGSGVRKEPGSESSAKGSLLVETPSF
jgi:hypothetical protein